MSVPLELFSLGLYVVQQAGMMLGAGAAVVLLVAYLLSLGERTDAHSVYMRAARFAERLGLSLIILSGVGAVTFHAGLGQWSVLAAPAFIGKWLLIGFVLVGYKVERALEGSPNSLGQSLLRGTVGGTWIALFLLHTTAIDMSSGLLAVGYAVWMALFMLVWMGFIGAVRMPRIILPSLPRRAEQKPAAKPAVSAQPVKIAEPVVTPIALKVSAPLQPVSKPAPVATPVAKPVVAAAPAPRAPVPVAASAPAAPKAAMPSVYNLELEAHHAPSAAPAPKPVAAAVAPVPPKAPEAAPAPSAPASGLPSIRVMPRNEEDLAKQQIKFA